MITKEQAVAASYCQVFHHTSLKNADGTPVRCRVNGACKTWVTRPDEFRLPVKYGLKGCFYITQSNAHEWVVPGAEDTTPRPGDRIHYYGIGGNLVSAIIAERAISPLTGNPRYRVVDMWREMPDPEAGRWVGIEDVHGYIMPRGIG